MATPNRGYPIPTTSAPATVPADLEGALNQVDADVQATIDRVGEVETVAQDAAGAVASLDAEVQAVGGRVTENTTSIQSLDGRVGTVEADVDALKRGAGLGVQAADLLASRLAFGTGDVVVGVAGDSTANDPGDWPRVMCSMLAARYPALRVEHHQWNDALSDYDPPVIVQAGEGEPAFSGTVLADTFSRATDLLTPDTGGPWVALNPDRWVLDGNTATTTGSARLRADAGTRDFTSTLTLAMDTTATGVAQTLRTYHGDSANGMFTQVTINAGGAATLYVFRVEGASSTQVASVALSALGLTSGGGTGTLTVEVDGQIQNYTVTATVGGQSWTREFTISEAVYAAMGTNLDVFPQSAMTGIALDAVEVSVADRPATYQTLTVKAGTKGGGTMQYQIDNWAGMFGDEEATPGTPPGPVEVTVRDTFTRTGDVAGSTTDTGQTWTGAAGKWAVDGSSAGSSAGGSVYLTVPGAETVSALVDVTTASTVTQTLRLGMAARGDATHGFYVGIGVSASGAFTPSAYVRTPTGGFRNLGAIPGHGVTSGNTTPVQVPVSITRDGLDFTVTAGDGGAVFTITSAEAAELGDMIELQAVTLALSGIRVAQIEATYLYDDPGTPPSAGDPLDVMILAHGHNYGALDGTGYQARLDEFAGVVAEHRPSTRLFVASQNPEFAPAGNAVRHAERQAAARLWAKRHGHSYAPVFEHFHAQPDQGQAWVLADGIHPTPSPGGAPTDGTGGTEWARVIVGSILG